MLLLSLGQIGLQNLHYLLVPSLLTDFLVEVVSQLRNFSFVIADFLVQRFLYGLLFG
jgi:hypothetical protein